MPRSSVKKTNENELEKPKTAARKTTAKTATAEKKKAATKKSPTTKTTTKTTTKKATSSKKAVEAKKDTSTKKNSATATKASAKADVKTKAVVSKKTTTKAKALSTKKSTTKTASTKTKAKEKKPSIVKLAIDKVKKELKSNKGTNPSDIQTLKKFSESFFDIIEYYDLPYRYNQTVVKVLAQNPNTLFVYWEVSDEDLENLEKQFGENFLEITRPVLVVHNLTDNYSFEIDINDFANNWYVYVEDTKCKYSVELGRRPNLRDAVQNVINNEFTNFVKIISSNIVEIPNDHVLFYEANDRLYFKNIETDEVTEKTVNLQNVKDIYQNYNTLKDDTQFDFENPSSQSPSSNVM